MLSGDGGCVFAGDCLVFFPPFFPPAPRFAHLCTCKTGIEFHGVLSGQVFFYRPMVECWGRDWGGFLSYTLNAKHPTVALQLAQMAPIETISRPSIVSPPTTRQHPPSRYPSTATMAGYWPPPAGPARAGGHGLERAGVGQHGCRRCVCPPSRRRCGRTSWCAIAARATGPAPGLGPARRPSHRLPKHCF